MDTDKRPFYVWMVVLIANLGTILWIIFFNISDENGLFELWNVLPLGISIFLSVVPVLISKSNGRLKNRFGYGIPVLLLLPVPYFIYDYYTCTGKFCEFIPVFIGGGLIVTATFFALFYTIGILASKWSNKFVLSLIWIEIVLLTGLVIGSAFYLFN